MLASARVIGALATILVHRRMRIDSMALADEAFLCCRYLLPATDALLEALQDVMKVVHGEGILAVERPASLAQLSERDLQDRFACDPTDASSTTPPSSEQQRLLRTIETGAVELRRLRRCGASGAVRSLGYALHPLPQLVSSGGVFEPGLFGFNLRVAARWWSTYSIQMHEELCRLAEVERDRVALLLDKDGFVIDMYRS